MTMRRFHKAGFPFFVHLPVVDEDIIDTPLPTRGLTGDVRIRLRPSGAGFEDVPCVLNVCPLLTRRSNRFQGTRRRDFGVEAATEPAAAFLGLAKRGSPDPPVCD